MEIQEPRTNWGLLAQVCPRDKPDPWGPAWWEPGIWPALAIVPSRGGLSWKESWRPLGTDGGERGRERGQPSTLEKEYQHKLTSWDSPKWNYHLVVVWSATENITRLFKTLLRSTFRAVFHTVTVLYFTSPNTAYINLNLSVFTA